MAIKETYRLLERALRNELWVTDYPFQGLPTIVEPSINSCVRELQTVVCKLLCDSNWTAKFSNLRLDPQKVQDKSYFLEHFYV